MRRLGAICVIFGFALTARIACGQGSAPAALSSRSPDKGEKSRVQKTLGENSSPDKTPAEKKEKTGGPKSAVAPGEAIVTEIYSDEVVFDSAKSIGIFTGHIIVNDPRFNIQGEKLTIYINKKQGEGLEKAVVEGNVAVVRERPDPAGGPPSRMLSRSDKAVYTAKDGNFELTGSPRVQQGLNTNVATSPETIMILNETGQLQTRGPSRTEIRQEPKAAATPKP